MMSAIVLTGCNSKSVSEQGPQSTPSITSEESSNSTGDETKTQAPIITEYKQSPYLDGKGLPPVAERLPKQPKLTNEMAPEDLDYKVGVYGGTLRTVRTAVTWDAMIFQMQNEPLLNSPSLLKKEITGND